MRAAETKIPGNSAKLFQGNRGSYLGEEKEEREGAVPCHKDVEVLGAFIFDVEVTWGEHHDAVVGAGVDEPEGPKKESRPPEPQGEKVSHGPPIRDNHSTNNVHIRRKASAVQGRGWIVSKENGESF